MRDDGFDAMISVCMAAYNGEKYIHCQIASILKQLASDDELIISDDGSSDGTLGIIEGFCDSRILSICNVGAPGLLFNIESALRLAQGDYVFLADQDDVWLPGRIAEMTLALQEFDVVVSDAIVTDQHLTVAHPSLFQLLGSGSGIIKNLIKNTYVGCCMAFRKTVLEAALPFPQDTPMHDWWIGMIGELNFSTCFLRRPLLYYRRHDANLSCTVFGSKYAMKQKFVWRYVMGKNLIRRQLEF